MIFSILPEESVDGRRAYYKSYLGSNCGFLFADLFFMPITRTKKEEIVRLLKEKISKASSLAFVKFHGLSVVKASQLRKKFRAVDSDYTVAKKSLLKIALKESGKELTADLEGEVALAAGYGDEVDVFKVVAEFARKEKDVFQILGGVFGGNIIDAQTAKALGMIPSREVLLAQVMRVLLGNTRKFVYILDKLSKRSN